MADVNNPGDDQAKSIDDLTKQLEALQVKHEKLNTDYRDLKAASADTATLQKQLDKAVGEKSKLMAEKEELQTQFTAFKEDLSKKELDQTLTTALEAAGARNPSTVKKFLDPALVKRDENGNVDHASLAEAINAIKVSDGYMFKDEGDVPPKVEMTSTPTTGGQLPRVKHAADKLTNSGYQTELEAAALTGRQENIDAVIAKHAELLKA